MIGRTSPGTTIKRAFRCWRRFISCGRQKGVRSCIAGHVSAHPSAAVMQASRMDARPFHAGMRRDVRMHLQRDFLKRRMGFSVRRVLSGWVWMFLLCGPCFILACRRGGMPTIRSKQAGQDGQSALARSLTQPGNRSGWMRSKTEQGSLALIRQAGMGGPRMVLRRGSEFWAEGRNRQRWQHSLCTTGSAGWRGAGASFL